MRALHSSVAVALGLGLVLLAVAAASTGQAQLTSPYPSASSLWDCPADCGAAATAWCTRVFGAGGALEASRCVSDPLTGLLATASEAPRACRRSSGPPRTATAR